jgi:hypothetical protein
MASNSKDWMRSITIASPVLLATVVSLVFVISSIMNPVDTTAGAVNPDQDGSGDDTLNQDVIALTANALYMEYFDFSQDTDSATFHRFTGRQLKVTGILASWESAGEPFLTLITDSFGNDNVRFIFNYEFTDTEIMDSLIGEPVTVFGISRGLIGVVVILRDAFSHDFDINSPSTLG